MCASCGVVVWVLGCVNLCITDSCGGLIGVWYTFDNCYHRSIGRSIEHLGGPLVNVGKATEALTLRKPRCHIPVYPCPRIHAAHHGGGCGLRSPRVVGKSDTAAGRRKAGTEITPLPWRVSYRMTSFQEKMTALVVAVGGAANWPDRGWGVARAVFGRAGH